METTDTKLLSELKEKIHEIEDLVLQLKDMGQGIPAVEKNARCILSFTHTLRFGISDLCDLKGQ
jgi:hypothetical protein